MNNSTQTTITPQATQSAQLHFRAILEDRLQFDEYNEDQPDEFLNSNLFYNNHHLGKLAIAKHLNNKIILTFFGNEHQVEQAIYSVNKLPEYATGTWNKEGVTLTTCENTPPIIAYMQPQLEQLDALLSQSVETKVIHTAENIPKGNYWGKTEINQAEATININEPIPTTIKKDDKEIPFAAQSSIGRLNVTFKKEPYDMLGKAIVQYNGVGRKNISEKAILPMKDIEKYFIGMQDNDKVAYKTTHQSPEMINGLTHAIRIGLSKAMKDYGLAHNFHGGYKNIALNK